MIGRKLGTQWILQAPDALTAAFLEFDADKKASVAVFYGAGGAFCAGWDLKYVSTLNADYPIRRALHSTCAAPEAMAGTFRAAHLGPSRLELDKPVIAAIRGTRLLPADMESGLWCDFRVMAKSLTSASIADGGACH